MTRATVRAAVTAFLQPPAVPGLNVVRRSQFKDTVSAGIYSFGSGAPGETNGAIAWIDIEQTVTQPEAPDGAGGSRMKRYEIVVRVTHRSVEPDAEVAMDQYDALMEALEQRLASDPNLGLGQANASAQGLVSGAYETLMTESEAPMLAASDGGEIDTWGAVRFPVLEFYRIT